MHIHILSTDMWRSLVSKAKMDTLEFEHQPKTNWLRLKRLRMLHIAKQGFKFRMWDFLFTTDIASFWYTEISKPTLLTQEQIWGLLPNLTIP